MLRTINGVDFLLAFIITVLIVYIAMLRQTEHDLRKAITKYKGDAEHWYNEFYECSNYYKCEVCGNTDKSRVICWRCLEN